MAETLKSAAITNLDANPPVITTAAEGAAERLFSVDGTITATAGATASTYQLCRIKSSARLKHVYVGVDVTVATWAADLGFYYSTSSRDGTPYADNQTLTAVNTTSGSQLCGAAQNLATAGFSDFIKNVSSANRIVPLWKACGLTSDPGGYFDFVATATSANTAGAVISAEIVFKA